MEVGAEVVVTKGKHEGKRGIIQRVTAKKVCVKLDFVDTLLLISSVSAVVDKEEEDQEANEEPPATEAEQRGVVPEPVYNPQLLGHAFGHSFNVYGIKRIPTKPNTFLICVSNASSCCQIWRWKATEGENLLSEAFRFESQSIEVPYKRGTDVKEEEFDDCLEFSPNGRYCFLVAADKASKTNQCWLFKFDIAKCASEERGEWMQRHECEEGTRVSAVKHAPTAPHLATTEINGNGQHSIVIRDPRNLKMLARVPACSGIPAPVEPEFRVTTPITAVEPKIGGLGWLGTDVLCIVQKKMEGHLLVWATKPEPPPESATSSSWSTVLQSLSILGSSAAVAAKPGVEKPVSKAKARWFQAARKAIQAISASKIVAPYSVKVCGQIFGKHLKLAVSKDGMNLATISEGHDSRHQEVERAHARRYNLFRSPLLFSPFLLPPPSSAACSCS
jgi:hypothetical protein